MRERIPVVVQGQRRRPRAVRVLWAGAELAVTFGVLVLLLVVHQLYWTNRQAQASAREQVARLERQWETQHPPPAGPPSAGPSPGPADPSGPSDPSDSTASERQGARTRQEFRSTLEQAAPPRPRRDAAYAVLRIPRLGLTVPVAEGTGRSAVLNKGFAGHYAHTAQPGEQGNFALAGHRNTHGEPFRFLNRLRPGDTVEVVTAAVRYTYAVDRTLPRTTPSDGTVTAPVPYSSAHPSLRYTEPAAYLTLTTCTPEYSSAYRLVVWGRLTGAAPR
ncbi:class E sortase [Streptomyces sp. CB02923]|uniref:class E sortase n=1 Tax=Streptomyces sp. CB02923 TaxID=1718985 RepID=UPI00093C8CCA|nr:class E sortase [Streptomyces sp. CB02923]OKI04491.1 class E sortase [Streptomyces sp. CB02923]